MNTTNMNLEDTILRAMDIIATQKIVKAGYDKTIQATIISCVDSTIGKYKVKYQDSYFIAYSNNADNFYSPNTNVYVLIPGGDMSKDKTILGATKHLGTNYIKITQDEDRVFPIGTNVISSTSTFGLCSYKIENKLLYSFDLPEQQNLLQIDNDAIKEYLKDSSSIIAGMHIKNNLNTQQRFQGNYGILFGLDFKDTASNTITRYYSIDVDTMSGNPYYYPNKVRQYGVFDIDGENFEKVNMIAIFTKDFPVQDNNMPDDIFISDIELTGAAALKQQDLDSCALVLLTPKGYIFSSENANNDKRTIQAQVRIKGKVIDPQSQQVNFYWFVENLSITAASSKFNQYGGQGWECLNSYQTIKNSTVSNGVTIPAILHFNPGKNYLQVTKQNILAKTTKYKCVAVYDDIVLSRETKIIRHDSQYNIQITSSKGQNFYNNAGSTTLTCKCTLNNSNHTEVDVDNLNFVWGRIDNFGAFNNLPDTEVYNTNRSKLIAIQTAIVRYIESEYLLNHTLYNVNSLLPSDDTIANIVNTNQKNQVTAAKSILTTVGLTSTAAITSILRDSNVETSGLTYKLVLDGDETHTNSLKAAISRYDGLQRVSGNIISGIQVSSITDFVIYKCSVFTKVENTFLGTASIMLNNSLNGNEYRLVINNGTQVFKYNTHGVSPASGQNKEPLVIPALSFTIYDSVGNVVEEDIVQNADITWIRPNGNTLLKTTIYDSDNNVIKEYDNINNTISYKNLTTFAYSIADNYNINWTRNNIELRVQYNNSVLIAHTNLTFLKQGENGTNGTDFVCKVIPNVTSGETPINPTIYYNGSNVSFNWNTDTTNNKWFKAQLWHNGNDPIFEGTETGNSSEGKQVKVEKWEVLKNVYALNTQDSTNLAATAAVSSGASLSNWSFSFVPNRFGSSFDDTSYLNWRPANIIKVTLSYDGVTYYATLPVIVCRIFNNNYSVRFKDYSGFREVIYNSNGQSPRYDSHAPFEVSVFYKVGNNWEDITEKTTDNYKLSYQWYYLGSVWNKEKNSASIYVWNENIETTNSSTGESSKKWLLKSSTFKNLKSHQKGVKPADNYNGQCVNTAMVCKIKMANNNTTIAWMHIPIHMMRNRFENSAINSWDGNSVNLGGTNGGMILAPQAGAGYKNSNNQFTGIVIGTAKDPQEDNSSSIGSLGSSNEDVGLFGYHEGKRSIFLDAKTGKAIFGEKSKARIILDPSQSTAQIYSGNYNTDNKTGLLIDLTTPSIEFGSGNFSVDALGYLTAKGGGSIASWEINNTAIFNKTTATGVSRNSTGMNSNPVVDSTSTSINGIGNGSEYRAVRVPPITSSEGSTGYKVVDKAAAFWAGGSKFFVTHDGYLRAEQASIGSGNAPIFIGKSGNESAIFSGLKSSKTADRSGFYLGTDGIGIGTTGTITIGNSSQTVSNFQVDKDGKFFARNGYISGTINATDGKIGNWYIKANSISSNGQDYYYSSGTTVGTQGMYFGIDGLRIGANFHVDSSGTAKLLGSLTTQQQWSNLAWTKTVIDGGRVNFYWRASNTQYSRAGGIGPSFFIGTTENIIDFAIDSAAKAMIFSDDSSSGRNYIVLNRNLTTTVYKDFDVSMGSNVWVTNNLILGPGRVSMTGNFYSDGEKRIVIQGTLYATGGIVNGGTSDERLKNIIKKDDSLDDFILSLNPIKYTWKNKDKFDQKDHYGLGAQTTLKKMQQYGITGNLAKYHEEADEYTVTYSELAPMMLITVQKNRKKIEALEQQIAILQNMIKDIKGDKK